MKRPDTVAKCPGCWPPVPNPQPLTPFLFLFLLLLLSIPRTSSASPIITSISIHGNVRTRTETVTRELLFAVGDTLDVSLVAESERNLRALLFLGAVRIVTASDSSGVDVTVHIQDLYARGSSLRLSGEIDELSYGIVAVDYNLFGRGQTARVSLDHDAITGNWATGSYLIPRLSGSRVRLYAFAGGGSEGHDIRTTLSQPFYALSARTSWGLDLASRRFIQRLYSSEALVDKYDDRLDSGHVWYARSYGSQVKVRPDVEFAVSDRSFSPEPGFTYAPTDRTRVLPSAGLTIWRPHYETKRFVRELGRTEDLQTGSFGILRAGFSSSALGSDRSFAFYRAQFSPRLRPHPDLYLFGLAYLNFRREDGRPNNIHAGVELAAYRQVAGLHTFALRVRWDAIARMEDSSQLLLGVNRGLRGYSPRRFDGSRRLILNAEARPTFYRHPRFIVGASLFSDAGTAWTPGVTSARLNASAGAGLRVSFPKIYDHMLIRTDLAYGFRNQFLQLSFGIGQYF